MNNERATVNRIIIPAFIVAAVFAATAMVLPDSALAQTTLVIRIGSPNPAPVRPTAPINNLKELSWALARCWRPPRIDPERQPVDVAFQVSFMRSGVLFGKPQFVDFGREVTQEQRTRYYLAIAQALDLCSQMPFTDSMGDAVAGRLFRITFVDLRNRQQAVLSGENQR